MLGIDRIIAGCAIFVLFLIGFVNIFRDIERIEQRKRFTYEFLERLGKYLQSQGQDYEVYAWLIHRSTKMQSYLGRLGIIAFKPPFANYIHNNYPVILNILPEIRKEFEDHRLTRDLRLIGEYSALLNETILRYIGILDDQLEVTRKELRNPFIWLREGIQHILIFPLALLNWFGIIGASTVTKVIGNALFKLFAGIIALLSLFGTIVTIVTGWASFLKIMQEIIKFL